MENEFRTLERLEKGYREMGEDLLREREAEEWCNRMIVDAVNKPEQEEIGANPTDQRHPK
jgi:hypothetical protein